MVYFATVQYSTGLVCIQCVTSYNWLMVTQVESGRSDSLASRGSLQSAEEVSAVGAVSMPSRPTDSSSDVTSFSIRRQVGLVV